MITRIHIQKELFQSNVIFLASEKRKRDFSFAFLLAALSLAGVWLRFPFKVKKKTKPTEM
jgi:hypothetical protein